MRRRGGDISADTRHPLRRGLAFIVSGGAAFAVDASVLELLSHGLGVHPILARLVAISLAMIAGFFMHRRYSFAVAAPPSIAEFLRYGGVAWTAVAINYGLFVLILLIDATFPLLVALTISSLVAMVFSYLGMRFAAFRGQPRRWRLRAAGEPGRAGAGAKEEREARRPLPR